MNRLALAGVVIGLAVGARAETMNSTSTHTGGGCLESTGHGWKPAPCPDLVEWLGPMPLVGEFRDVEGRTENKVAIAQDLEWGILWNADGTGTLVVRRRK